ncbi:amino acid permease [Bombella sp. TMW 2.2559]|uniref:Amino acid permease n=1 Tax=Bombella dulcis TaxID=2967339 RepID=A0ABT3WDK3_9PROT|nr:amino acid permease [Bombella dulcis]MCX5615869.1 amino acid permease [Bombella dulcis]
MNRARRKTLSQIQSSGEQQGLRRSLGATQLLLMGVGTAIGAGVYVITGTAAAEYAGPSVLLSFLIAAAACLFTALCYGELASTFPVSGSAYAYAYLSMGEKMAWVTGWLLLLEYGIAGTAVAAGFAGYLTSLLKGFGVHIPDVISQTTFQSIPHSSSGLLTFHHSMNLIGLAVMLFISLVLVRGIETAARFNTVFVAVKIGVLVLFVGVGLFYLHPAYWHPFIPPSQGNFHFGVAGIFRAASIIFFAYGGFEAVSTAAAEARNPTRDVPIGIIGSLIICTLVYVTVAAVLLGIAPYQMLDAADPLSIATGLIHKPWMAFLINTGATVGLFSVLIGLLYAISRMVHAISHDGLLPRFFGIVHPRFRTPWLATLLLGLIMGLMSATMPIALLGDLLCIGTTLAFAIVCFTVIWQRNRAPGTPRPFQVPLGGIRIRGLWLGITPLLGILFCLCMIVPLGLNILNVTLHGNLIPLIFFILYTGLGFATYLLYGRHNSTMKPPSS